ncbi:hypothetical protein Poli38472_009872 [Pythium oligandrum]|uniref:EF-hand domain-containing protein n=1 Tax=Pythium oligandrum TaxID=41045 RepID=A0A8K1CF91_PYTOL|nr:hypothetical protein Poli38472_009872 [Pythium oligandrum]|eukprot:TMW62379.1 hypothetical protein Poli38472_009872 [Pythium oligandrum]
MARRTSTESRRTSTRRSQVALRSVTPIGSHDSHVLVRLRKGREDGTKWVTELICFLFNAQGDVLQIHRGDKEQENNTRANVGSFTRFGNENVVIRRFESREAIQKEVLSVHLAEMHPSVEVVGVLVTYSAYEIAQHGWLNPCFVTCEAAGVADEGQRNFASEQPMRLFEYNYDPRSDSNSQTKAPDATYAVVCKIYRNVDNRSEWLFDGIGESGAVRSSVSASLRQPMQVYLLDIIPEIEIEHRNALNSVVSVCAALSYDEFLGIEQYFDDAGVDRRDFARLILLALLRSRPELQRPTRVTSLVALLYEMFDQIDINGDGAVDWEEFTTFCINMGLLTTNGKEVGKPDFYGAAYRQKLVGTRNFPYQIHRIRLMAGLRRIAVVENKSSVVLMYDTEMMLLHEMDHVLRLDTRRETAVCILDVDYVTSRNLVALSSNDNSISLWSVVNATSGAYVFAFKIGSRAPIPEIKWCNGLNRLVTVSSEGVQLWDLESRRVSTRLSHHQDRMTDCLELPDLKVVATCSFDRKIAILDIQTLKVEFVLEGHVQGVKQLDYMHGLLLSSGFEHQAYCWSVSSRTLITTLGGHQTSLIGACFVSSRSNIRSAMAVTGDDAGHFRLWDISMCLAGSAKPIISVVQSFDVSSPNLCRFRVFTCGMILNDPNKHRDSDNDLLDIITGSFQLYKFHVVTRSDDSSPVRFVTFNSISNWFVGSVDGCITIWNANSGVKIEDLIFIRDAEVCGIAFDLPRQRKLFIATSDGAIRLYNPITAMIMSKTVIHDGIISSLIFCPKSLCIITTGYDRRICVSHSSAGKTNLEILRTVENAHEFCISACAYSHELELLATGDDTGNIHVYDFEKLYLQFRCEGHSHEIQDLQFHYSAALLVSADGNGVVFIWCEPTIVWQAHEALITRIKPLPYPGALFSVSLDCSVKIWDATHVCIGTFSTIEVPKTPAHTSDAAKEEENAKSGWKYAHHTSSDARDAHAQITDEILRYIKRESKKYHVPVERGGTLLDELGPEALFSSHASHSSLPPNLVAIEAKLSSQTPFSKESLRSGIQQGLFGADETRRILDLSRNQRMPSSFSKVSLAPLGAPTEKSPTRKKKQDRVHPEGNEHKLPVMRTLQNFPIEIERRMASRFPSAQGLDIEPSVFLKEKLECWSPHKSLPKSTSKKRMTIKMDANVAILNNISLPEILSPNTLPEPTASAVSAGFEVEGSSLTAYASAPTLSVYSPWNDERSDDHGRSNIQRKMRIYEHSTVGDMGDMLEPKSMDKAESIRDRPRLIHRLSQPQLSIGPGTQGKKRLVQVGMSSSGSSASLNPFGPYYTLKQVMEFGAIIARFDQDFSGDIDKGEWVNMLQSFRPLFALSDMEAAEKLFHAIDRDDSGKISLKEILPMMVGVV